MSRKHNQRTRAEILAKRSTPIAEIPVQKKVLAPNGQTLYVPQPTSSERLRAAFDASKYMPHIGAKEQERAKRWYMSDRYPKLLVSNAQGFFCQLRSAPTLCQMSKATHLAYLEAREQEYESVF